MSLESTSSVSRCLAETKIRFPREARGPRNRADSAPTRGLIAIAGGRQKDDAAEVPTSGYRCSFRGPVATARSRRPIGSPCASRSVIKCRNDNNGDYSPRELCYLISRIMGAWCAAATARRIKGSRSSGIKMRLKALVTLKAPTRRHCAI